MFKLTEKMNSDQSVRTIDLKNCPLGKVFDVAEKDQSVESTYFGGWRDPFCFPYISRQDSYSVIWMSYTSFIRTQN